MSLIPFIEATPQLAQTAPMTETMRLMMAPVVVMTLAHIAICSVTLQTAAWAKWGRQGEAVVKPSGESKGREKRGKGAKRKVRFSRQ